MVKRWELKKREIELKWVLLEFVMSAKYKYDKIPMLTKKNKNPYNYFARWTI